MEKTLKWYLMPACLKPQYYETRIKGKEVESRESSGTLHYTYVSSSSSCHAGSTDIPDPLSPLSPIVHHLWQVFWTTSRILT